MIGLGLGLLWLGLSALAGVSWERDWIVIGEGEVFA
jgi:hypothetical protein